MSKPTGNPTGRPPKVTDPEEMIRLGHDWIDQRIAENKTVTITGLAYAIGVVNRQGLWEYGKKPIFSDAVKELTARVIAWWEENLTKQAAAGIIFWLKNHQWSDRQELEHSGNMSLSVSYKDTGAGKPGKASDNATDAPVRS